MRDAETWRAVSLVSVISLTRRAFFVALWLAEDHRGRRRGRLLRSQADSGDHFSTECVWGFDLCLESSCWSYVVFVACDCRANGMVQVLTLTTGT
jgi:hypothetical protein